MWRLLPLLASIGCSLGLRPVGDPQVIDCTDDYVLPALDTAAWIASAVGAVFAFERRDNCSALDCLLLPGAGVATLVLPLVAANGYYKVHQCRASKREGLRARI